MLPCLQQQRQFLGIILGIILGSLANTRGWLRSNDYIVILAEATGPDGCVDSVMVCTLFLEKKLIWIAWVRDEAGDVSGFY